MRSHEAMENAELVIAVIDGSGEVTAEDEEIIRCAEKAPHAVVAVSKSDLGKKQYSPKPRSPLWS